MDISVNKPANKFLRQKFHDWYADQVLDQVEEEEDIDAVEINLSMPVLKETGAKWLVEMADYLSHHPQFITNGFRRAGIIGALDGEDVNEAGSSDDSTSVSESDMDSDDDVESVGDCSEDNSDSEDWSCI